MTLAPEIAKVSWASMGLRQVPLLAEVLLAFVEVPGFLAWLGRSSPRGCVSQSSFGRLGMSRFQIRPGWRPRAGALPFWKFGASGLVPTRRLAQHASGRSCHFDFGITTVLTPRVIMRGGLTHVSDVSHQLLPRSAAATAVVVHDAEVGCRNVGGYPFAALL
jgi:hypothetical protein